MRFSDDFRSASEIPDPKAPFVLAASTGRDGTRILHSGAQIGSRPAALKRRNLAPPYVIGQQGNIDGEYWQGDIAVLLVYDRQLDTDELSAVSVLLADRYGIALRENAAQAQRTPEFLALASVCHVLMNSNEFLYVD